MESRLELDGESAYPLYYSRGSPHCALQQYNTHITRKRKGTPLNFYPCLAFISYKFQSPQKRKY